MYLPLIPWCYRVSPQMKKSCLTLVCLSCTPWQRPGQEQFLLNKWVKRGREAIFKGEKCGKHVMKVLVPQVKNLKVEESLGPSLWYILASDSGLLKVTYGLNPQGRWAFPPQKRLNVLEKTGPVSEYWGLWKWVWDPSPHCVNSQAWGWEGHGFQHRGQRRLPWVPCCKLGQEKPTFDRRWGACHRH